MFVDLFNSLLLNVFLDVKEAYALALILNPSPSFAFVSAATSQSSRSAVEPLLSHLNLLLSQRRAVLAGVPDAE